MDPSAPPPYSSQPQLFQRPSQGNFNVVQPQAQPAQMPPGWPPPYQLVQRLPQDNSYLHYLFRCSYCFGGSRSSGIRYATIALGALLLVHGIVRISIAGAAIPEANDKRALPNSLTTKPYFTLIEFYSRYINIVLIGASEYGTLGVLFGAILPALITEIFPGPCLIAAGVLLKPVFCALPIVSLIAGIGENIFDFVGVFSQVGGFFGGHCELSECGRGTIAAAFIIRTLHIAFFQFCISLDVTLWQQIRYGLYNVVNIQQPPAPLAGPIPTAGPEREPRIAVEQTDPATDPSSSG